MGNDPRLCGMGRRADPGPAGRFRNRRRLGPLHPVARDITPPTPGGPNTPEGLYGSQAKRELIATIGHSTVLGQSQLQPSEWTARSLILHFVQHAAMVNSTK